tara:strand:+ start:275 stop:622 length:348 start_codon:yes stop_codon:yes gene_type:complete
MQYLIKIVLSSIIIVSVSEIAKRVSWIAAIVASLPLVSILALIWLYIDTHDVQKIIALSNEIFWAVLPSLLFFAILPVLLRMGFNFPLALILSMVIMFLGYSLYVLILNYFGIKF